MSNQVSLLNMRECWSSM